MKDLELKDLKMTMQDIKNVVASLSVSQASRDTAIEKTSKGIDALKDRMNEHEASRDAAIEKTSKGIDALKDRMDDAAQTIKAMGVRVEETTQAIKEMGVRVDDTTETLKNLGLHVDGISKTTGEIAQEFFFSSLGKYLQLGGVQFDFIDSNILRRSKGKGHEIDIFLENGDTVGIVEVKNKVRKESIEQLKKTVDNFYQFHPNFKRYKIISAMAGKVFPQALQESALNQGIIVLTQQGDHIEQRCPLALLGG